MNLHMYLPLYRASLKGDWEKANEFLNLHPGAENAMISRGWETALHISAGARRTKFVEELVKRMRTTDLEIQNKDNNTALCFAAASGVTKIAKLMVDRNRNLPVIRGSEGVTPLYIATLLGQRDMVWYLYSVTNHEILKTEDYFSLLIAAISTDLYGNFQKRVMSPFNKLESCNNSSMNFVSQILPYMYLSVNHN